MNIGPFYVYIGSGDAPAWVDEVFGKLEQMESRIMAKVEDKINELNGVLETIGASVTGVQSDVSSLSTEIQSLKDQIASGGGLTPAQEAAFDAAIVKARSAADALAALDSLNPATPPAPAVATPDVPAA